MTHDVLELARGNLTPKQFEAFYTVHHYGLSIRAAANHLGLHRSTFIDRYDNAILKLNRAGIRFTPDGTPYLENV